MTDGDWGEHRPVRVVRVIARLNIGGPAIQAITLTKELEAFGYHTTLVRGREEPDEGSMDGLAQELGVEPVLVPALRRNPGWHDLAALWELTQIIRRERPDIVHTHAAKGGTLGRVAALIGSVGRRRPLIFHTYHGHSLTGYFSPRTATVYRAIERVLARFTDRLIVVSDEIRDELVELGIAQGAQFDVVRLGFDLSPFTLGDPERARKREGLRSELGIATDDQVVTLIARLVPIKRVDRFLRMAEKLMDLDGIRFIVVGDGELRESLQASREADALGDRLVWAGFRQSMPEAYFASDVVVQTSDNEGTPVSLIEAQASGVPVVSTHVGGVASVVRDSRFLARTDDERKLASAVRVLLDDADLANQVATVGQKAVLAQFELDRLVADIDGLYRATIENRGDPAEQD